MSTPSSILWNNFDKIPNTTSARCLLCSKLFSYKTSITNLKKHLLHKHKSAFNELTDASYNDATNITAITMDNIENNDSSTHSDFKPSDCESEESHSSLQESVHKKSVKDTSNVWTNFNKIPNTTSARCLLCSKLFSYKTSITNLKKHLLHKHKSAFNELTDASDNVATITTNISMDMEINDRSTHSNFKLSDCESEESHSSLPESVHKKSVKTTSSVWKIFKKIPNTSLARCLLCRKLYSHKTSLTNLKKHLIHKHKRASTKLKDTNDENNDSSYFDFKSIECKSEEPPLPLPEPVHTNNTNTISNIWKHFHKIPNKFLAKCLLCKKLYSYKTSSTNLKTHLKFKHRQAFSKNYENDDAVKQNNYSINSDFKSFDCETEYEEPRCSPELVFTTSVKTTPLSVTPSTSQKRKLQQYNCFPTLRKKHDSHKNEIDKKLLDMIIKDLLPLSIVEEQGFRDFVKALNPNYELPTKKAISSTLIGKYTKSKNQVKELIQEAKTVCLTAENWTSVDKESYLAVTAHFMTDFELKNVLLHCENTSGSDSAEALALSLQNITKEWEINEKISLVVSNNTYNVKKAIEKNQWLHFDCFLQKINLTIEKAFEEIDSVIQEVQKIVAYFKNNYIETETLINYQNDFENKFQSLCLIRSDPTRWISVYFMLERFSKLQSSLEAIIPKLKSDIAIISSNMWSTIKQIVMILKPFEEATRIMSATRYLPASLAIIIIDGLRNVVQLIRKKPIFDTANTFLDSIEEGLNTYFPEREFKNNIILGVCTLIDPRFKMHAFFDQSSQPSGQKSGQRGNYPDVIKQHVVNLIQNKIKDKQQFNFSSVVLVINPQGSEWVESETIIIQQDSEPDTISVWEKIDKNIAAVTPSQDDTLTKAINELDMYLKEEVLDRNSCPLVWWKQHAVVYPNLAEIFLDHAHIVVSSVPCTRILPKGEKLFIDRRSYLGRKHMAELVFLNSNYANYS